MDPADSVVERMPVLSKEQFLTRYYAANRPVLIDGLVNNWAALARWTPEYLRATIPDALVQVMVDRAIDEDYEINSEQHKATMRMDDYVDRVLASGTGNDVYLTANNHFFENPDVARLLVDFDIPAPYLDSDTTTGTVFFWFGPGGTITPLHHDIINVLFIQVFGTKKFTLVPSLATHRVYNDIGVFSRLDRDLTDLDSYPLFAGCRRYDLTVGPGQALFIPVGWWHRVESVQTSISMSFTNFVYPNDFTWQHPAVP
jgi:ribosomal protein L16 Arg81 hydroxylase